MIQVDPNLDHMLFHYIEHTRNCNPPIILAFQMGTAEPIGKKITFTSESIVALSDE